ncbi:MAG: hypothetical protein RL095_4062 [Verrucomicrobiota bacterium]|jgi:hypothetical protein
MSKNHYRDLPEDAESWDEFRWEKLLRDSDQFAHHYFQLMKRFGSLPEGEILIDQHLGSRKLPTPPESSEFFVDGGDFDSADAPPGSEEENEDFDGGGPSICERHQAYLSLRQCALGWCNIFASFLSSEHRHIGAGILLHLGRACGYFSGALGDGNYEQPSWHIASAKRALDQVNSALGLIDQLSPLRPTYPKVTDPMKATLREVEDGIIDFIGKMRLKS